MKASSSTETDDGEAENKSDKPVVFDYCDFFSVLMYYAHMSKEEIMSHSRAFLHGIYRTYYKRACENLGVSATSEEESEEDNTGSEESYVGDYELNESDYPTEFTKLPAKPNKAIESSPEKTREFLAAFGAGAEVFKNVTIAEDN